MLANIRSFTICDSLTKPQFLLVIRFERSVIRSSFFNTAVSAQTGSFCPGDSITRLDKTTGKYECVDCFTCPEGEGLTVNCGSVITPQTPISCKPCVLGETYSAANEPGACKDCENCREYEETIKACTLTSKARCGKCKVGAYQGALLPTCVPCSQCCDDGNDVVIPACQVPGVPKDKQCSYARSGKCSKLEVTGKVSTKPNLSTTSAQEIPPSTVMRPSMNPTNKTTATDISHQGIDEETVAKEVKSSNTTSGTTPKVIVGSVIGGFVALAILIAFGLVWRRRSKKPFKTSTEAVIDVENQTQEDVQDESDVGNETDALNPVIDLPPVEETFYEPVQETGGSRTQLSTGVQESSRQSDSPVDGKGDTHGMRYCLTL